MNSSWQKQILLLLTPKQHKNSNSILYWREKIFYYVLFGSALLGLLTIIPSIISLLEDKLYIQIVIDLIVVSTFIYFVFDSKIPFKTKSILLLIIVNILAISLILMGGTYSIGGFVYLVASSILASIWRGTKMAILTIVFNTLAIATIAYLSYIQLIYIDTLATHNLSKWITLGANIFIVNSISAISVSLLIEGLEQTINQTLKLKNELSEERIKLIEAKQRAEEADKLKTIFLGNMSHELKTPLNSIIGFSNHILDEKIVDPDEVFKYQKIIAGGGEMLLSLINDILDITVIESGQLKIEKAKVSLDHIINDISNTFDERLIDTLHKDIKFNIIDKLGINDFQFISDPLRLKQVINNLIKNAFKFTNEGEINFSFHLSDDKKHLVFSVQDTGIGILPEKQSEIFLRFSKLNDTSNNKIKGTGLGLTISKEIVELLGGRIWLESVHGKGSTFYFTVQIENSEIQQALIL